MVPTEQMLHWIEQCEQAAEEHDLAKLTSCETTRKAWHSMLHPTYARLVKALTT
jgi:hypothetical protein